MMGCAPVGAVELLSGFLAEHHAYDMHARISSRTAVKSYH